jgi:hypothetical protein
MARAHFLVLKVDIIHSNIAPSISHGALIQRVGVSSYEYIIVLFGWGDDQIATRFAHPAKTLNWSRQYIALEFTTITHQMP